MRTLGWVFASVLLCHCGQSQEALGLADGSIAEVGDSGLSHPDASVDAVDGGLQMPDAGGKAARCAVTFGDALTAPYGRLDGTVRAVLMPSDRQCVMPNSSHVIVQVDARGQTYRMVVNVLSTRGDPDVRWYTGLGRKPLMADAYSEGWHSGQRLDYATDLDLHAADFTAVPFEALVRQVVDSIPLGARISVYAATTGGSSAHKVHRNGNGQDGALVLNVDAPHPRYLLFRFSDQSF